MIKSRFCGAVDVLRLTAALTLQTWTHRSCLTRTLSTTLSFGLQLFATRWTPGLCPVTCSKCALRAVHCAGRGGGALACLRADGAVSRRYKPRTPEDDEDSVAQTEDYTRVRLAGLRMRSVTRVCTLCFTRVLRGSCSQELLDDDEVSLDDLDLSVQARPAPQASARNGQSVLSLSFADLVQDTQRLGEQQVIISVLEKLVSAPHLERQRDALGLAQGFDFAKVYQRHTFMRVTTQDFHTVTAANDYDLYSA